MLSVDPATSRRQGVERSLVASFVTLRRTPLAADTGVGRGATLSVTSETLIEPEEAEIQHACGFASRVIRYLRNGPAGLRG
jgi:hypothetical protein